MGPGNVPLGYLFNIFLIVNVGPQKYKHSSQIVWQAMISFLLEPRNFKAPPQSLLYNSYSLYVFMQFL